MSAEDREELAHEIAFWMQGLDKPLPPLDEHARLVRQLCEQLRALAIMVLLGTGNSDRFHHNLIRSARLRLAFLRRCRAEGANGEHDFVSGILEPLHDAMAAGDWALATDLVRAAPADFRPGHEYEDDHHHARLLGLLLTQPDDAAAQRLALQQLAAAVGDEDHPRVALLRVLVERRQQDFEGAFEAFTAMRHADIDEEAQQGGLVSAGVRARRQVHMEGLALIALAARRGLKPGHEHRLCPALARVPMREPLPADD
jgi:hypothetical protein